MLLQVIRSSAVFFARFSSTRTLLIPGILVVEIVWLGIGLVWLYHNYEVCDHGRAKEVIFTFTICNSVLIFMVFVIGWCSFDRAGRSFVKMKRYQNRLVVISIEDVFRS